MRTAIVDTGYPCRIERESGAVVLTGPPAGIIDVGGYRFAQKELQDLVGGTGMQASLAALPDPYLSHRLVGNAADQAASPESAHGEGDERACRGRVSRPAQAAGGMKDLKSYRSFGGDSAGTTTESLTEYQTERRSEHQTE